MKIERHDEKFELEIKRCHLPFTVSEPCPECGTLRTVDLRTGHLSYPKLGQPQDVYGYCTNCEHEWTMEVIFDVTLALPPGETSGEPKAQPVPKKWEEFRDAGLLWWVNRALHLFGWSIVITIEEKTGTVLSAYPAMVSHRGFNREAEENGFVRLTEHLAKNSTYLLNDVHDAVQSAACGIGNHAADCDCGGSGGSR